jgi:hypothetical protein
VTPTPSLARKGVPPLLLLVVLEKPSTVSEKRFEKINLTTEN